MQAPLRASKMSLLVIAILNWPEITEGINLAFYMDV